MWPEGVTAPEASKAAQKTRLMRVSSSFALITIHLNTSVGSNRPSGMSCLMMEGGSQSMREPLPATPFMAGSGGGRIEDVLVAADRS